MTKAELKMILKLIDNHTVIEEVGYYCTQTKRMYGRDIERLKQDIKDLFEEVEDK